jgi:hypothetical protein
MLQHNARNHSSRANAQTQYNHTTTTCRLASVSSSRTVDVWVIQIDSIPTTSASTSVVAYKVLREALSTMIRKAATMFMVLYITVWILLITNNVAVEPVQPPTLSTTSNTPTTGTALTLTCNTTQTNVTIIWLHNHNVIDAHQHKHILVNNYFEIRTHANKCTDDQQHVAHSKCHIIKQWQLRVCIWSRQWC